MTEGELKQQMIDILLERDFVSFKVEKEKINPNMSLLKDLSLDSIKLLEYLAAIEDRLNLNIDYEDLEIEIFDDFDRLAKYFYNKMYKK